MFGNFIYFIIVLLIYSTYQPTGATFFPLFEALVLFFSLMAAFTLFVRSQFGRLKTAVTDSDYLRLDSLFPKTLTRLSLLAIGLFALDVYALGLPSFFKNVPLFGSIPTLRAIIFISLFVFYLSIIWFHAYDIYRVLHGMGISKRAYVLSNISISVPVLLPWLVLSAIIDLIEAQPFDAPKALLSSTTGEIIFFIVFLAGVSLIGPVLIQKFWRCRPLVDGTHRQRIEALCRQAGIGYHNILYWPIFGGRMITAGVMGLVKRFRYILVTGALLNLLTPEELDSVIAHEIGHVKKRHLHFYFLFFMGYLIVSYVTIDPVFAAILYLRPVYWLVHESGFNPVSVTTAMFTLFLISIFILYFRYIFGYFMRNFERQADTYVYTLLPNARPLVSTLEKIARTSGQPRDKPNWHHFSIQERVDFLEKCEANRSWIHWHDRKIKKRLAIYLLGMITICTAGYSLNYGEAGKWLSSHFLEKIVLVELEKKPDNPDLLNLLGNHYYGAGKFQQAEAAYSQSIRLMPDNSHGLNNLAWLYATCEDKRLRFPSKALVLAQKAAAISEADFILDTLAECYFVNGNYQKAVEVGSRALELATERRSYFESQLRKFQLALEQAGQ
jgi:Zn-dependent protease with chaperone function